jgi:hypothetical protein
VCLRVLIKTHITCDEGNAGLPFSCLLTQILQSGISIAGEPKIRSASRL